MISDRENQNFKIWNRSWWKWKQRKEVKKILINVRKEKKRTRRVISEKIVVTRIKK